MATRHCETKPLDEADREGTKYELTGQFIQISAVFLLCVATLAASPITLTPGSLLVQQTGFPPMGTIHQYTPSGSLLGTLVVTGTTDIPESLTVLDGELFVSDGSGGVNLINLSSGAVISSFATGDVGLNGIGTYKGNLLTLSFSSNAVNVYSTAGILQQSIALASTPPSFTWNGIASDGTTLYLADFQSGRIYEYSVTGAAIGFLDTKLGTGLTGIAYSPSNNSLWVADENTNGVYDFSTNGTQLAKFATTGFQPDAGIAVVTPEPPYGVPATLVLATLAVCVMMRRNRRASSPKKLMR